MKRFFVILTCLLLSISILNLNIFADSGIMPIDWDDEGNYNYTHDQMLALLNSVGSYSLYDDQGELVFSGKTNITNLRFPYKDVDYDYSMIILNGSGNDGSYSLPDRPVTKLKVDFDLVGDWKDATSIWLPYTLGCIGGTPKYYRFLDNISYSLTFNSEKFTWQNSEGSGTSEYNLSGDQVLFYPHSSDHLFKCKAWNSGEGYFLSNKVNTDKLQSSNMYHGVAFSAQDIDKISITVDIGTVNYNKGSYYVLILGDLSITAKKVSLPDGGGDTSDNSEITKRLDALLLSQQDTNNKLSHIEDKLNSFNSAISNPSDADKAEAEERQNEIADLNDTMEQMEQDMSVNLPDIDVGDYDYTKDQWYSDSVDDVKGIFALFDKFKWLGQVFTAVAGIIIIRLLLYGTGSA